MKITFFTNAALVESAAAVGLCYTQCAIFLKEQEGQHPLTEQHAANFRRDLQAT